MLLLAVTLRKLVSINISLNFFNIIFLSIIWEFYRMYPITLTSHSSKVYPPTLVSPPSSPVCVAHILTRAWSNSLCPSP